MDNIFFNLYKKVIDERTHSNSSSNNIILRADNVGFSWNVKKNNPLYIIRNMSLTIRHNEIISIVGNTGVGKSTLAHIFSGRIPPSEGAVFVGEQAYEYGNKQSFYIQRAGIQLMPQIPTTSFHPFFSIERSLQDAFFMFKHSMMHARGAGKHDVGKKDRGITHLFYACIESLCLTFDMPLEFLKKLPSELSGGQLQRFALIRALLVFPHLLILDEPVSHLDISMRKSTLDTILMLYNSTDISLMLISHLEEVHNYFKRHTLDATTQYNTIRI